MKNRVLSVFILAVMLAASVLFTVPVFAAQGTAISSADELAALMNDSTQWSGTYYLANNIDLTEKTQAAIGNDKTAFTGTFDGNGKTVSGINISKTTVIAADAAMVGFFGVVENATIKNLTVKGSITNENTADINASSTVNATGGIVGKANGDTIIENCTAEMTLNGTCNVGGIVGLLSNETGEAKVINCVSSCKITLTLGNVGGIIGWGRTAGIDTATNFITGCTNNSEIKTASNDRARTGGIIGYISTTKGGTVIDGCVNKGNVSCINTYVSTGTDEAADNHVAQAGGIVGRLEITAAASSGIIKNCVNYGKIESSYNAGGIIAIITRPTASKEASECSIINCANKGDVIGTSYAGGIGGFVRQYNNGSIENTSISDCYNTGAVSSDLSAGGILGYYMCGDLKNIYNSGSVTAKIGGAAGAIVGTATNISVSGTAYSFIPSTYENVYYASGSASAVIGVSSFNDNTNLANDASTAGTTKESFKGFDFDNVWSFTSGAPVLKIAASSAPESTTAAAGTTVTASTSAATNGENTPATSDIPTAFAAAALLSLAVIMITMKKASDKDS